MAKYEITVVVESDNDFSNSEQIEELKDEITMTVANYNCFCQIGSTQVRKIN